MTKQRFLVLYDYETGGVWASLLARSRTEIGERYPELEVVDELPSWMTPDDKREIENEMTIDIDDDENPFMAALRKGRAGR